jgi:predicted permease
VASTHYHQTLGIPLVAGRLFTGTERPDGDRVAIVNETLARQHFGDAAVGRRLRLGAADSPWLTIVGVVGDVRHDALTETPDPEVYVPLAQAPPAMMMLAARTILRPQELTASIRAAVLAIDSAQPIYHVKPLETLVGESTIPTQTAAELVALFSALALMLAAIGIYGVVAYSVSQQMREFSLRMALGASPQVVMRQVLRHGAALVGTGIALGMTAALALPRLLGGVLVGVSPADPTVYAGVAVLLAITGLAACAAPALRASRTQPMLALRAD